MGLPLPRSPKWQTNFTLRYSHALADGELYALTDWSYRTEYNMFLYEAKEYRAKALLEGGRPADTPVLVVQHGTTTAQRTLRATLSDAPERIREEGIRPPAIIVIGSVAAFGG